MQQNIQLLKELLHEGKNTRKILERVPEDQFDWKPHVKSMSLGKLAIHISELPRWVNTAFSSPYFDFVLTPFVSQKMEGKAGLLANFDQCLKNAAAALETATEEQMAETWELRSNGHVIFSLPRAVVFRNLVHNHIVHHRGQLSVYLRLLDIPVPGMYGPSADER